MGVRGCAGSRAGTPGGRGRGSARLGRLGGAGRSRTGQGKGAGDGEARATARLGETRRRSRICATRTTRTSRAEPDGAEVRATERLGETRRGWTGRGRDAGIGEVRAIERYGQWRGTGNREVRAMERYGQWDNDGMRAREAATERPARSRRLRETRTPRRRGLFKAVWWLLPSTSTLQFLNISARLKSASPRDADSEEAGRDRG